MADTSRNPKAIILVDFQEETLATGRKLLTCIFKDRYTDWKYRWTPPWREKDKEHGIERAFLKALEVEEWNDPGGPWDEELKKAAEEVPSLKELQIPAQVECGGLATVAEEGWAYKIGVSILAESDTFSSFFGGPSSISSTHVGFRIGSCEINYEKLKRDFVANFSQRLRLNISKGLSEVRSGGDPYGDRRSGVYFTVWIPSGLERQDYRIIGREIAAFVRAYLRRVLADHERLKRGFEE